ncbi:DNA repair protein complementing XP-G cells homolog [Copidosoma floridanum]|uniref:DNA repair protein complementing XP-G cells homolog n=1 Tax=Copidosoma floridanum TaxID=29053 RepID=UPI000C6F50A2|nr:DNA repair protein complementing XP-G cells homolog [Copidosoma floridanum]
MGVLGLWKLVDATGKPVPLETLEGKVLAIDISIWIHQVIQGYQDRRGNALPNAHLIGLFNRICKLMYFKIKPVFVFDGGVPLLKKNTIATRRKLKSIASSKAQKLKNDLINNLIKHTAVKGALEKGNDNEESSTAIQQLKDTKASSVTSAINDMYKLPEIPSGSQLDPDDYINSEDEDELHLSPRKQSKWMGNIHSVDVDNEEFKNLPADVRYDILTDLKDTRKQNSWGRLHELPKGSNNYSGFQVKRLLKRRYVQESLEEAEKEMGGKSLTLEELNKLLTDQGINTTLQQDKAFRIASDSTTRVIYVKDSQSTQNTSDSESSKPSKSKEPDSSSKDATSDSLSVNSEISASVINDINAYDLDEEWNSDEGFETTHNESPQLTKNNIPKSVMNPALAYMLENSGFTRDQIVKIVEQRKQNQANSDTASSTASSKKERKKKKSLRLSVTKKRKLSFDVQLSKKKQETAEEPTAVIVESSSESEDFEEVTEKITSKGKSVENEVYDRTITKESSDDESDDFIEVQDVPIPEVSAVKKPQNVGLQIMINAEKDLEDDIFADIFSDASTVEKLVKSPEKKKESEEVVKKNFQDARIKQMEALKEVKSQLKAIKQKFETEKIDNESSMPTTPVKVQSEDTYKSFPQTSDKVIDSLTIGNLVEKIIDSAALEEIETYQDDIKEIQNEEKDENVVSDIDFGDSDFLAKTKTVENSTTNDIPKETEKVVETVKKPAIILPTDEKELESMKQQLENEQQQIAGSLGKLERQAIDITDQMRIEAQELLQLFGVPYIVAPMEAEAQCAYLEQVKLTNGTVTDDSDIWLFGGHCVYKNFFDNNKKVLQYLSNDIEHHFKLSRKEMILLALLVGSDYTNGLAAVGPVTALEILASFPCEGEDFLRGLRSFAAWFRAGKLAAPGKTTLRNKLKNVQIEKGFPSQAVVQAYLAPTIDESTEPFSWSKPNLVLLADYVKRKFGWTKLKFDEIMNPVMKRYNETQSQRVIDSYFKYQLVPKSIETAMSKRVQTAIQKLSSKGEADEELEGDAPKASTSKDKVKKPRKVAVKRGKKSKDIESELPAIAESVENEEESKLKIEQNEIKGESETEAVQVKSEPIKMIAIDEVIPQKEKDKVNALKSKLKAIEIFRKSKTGLDRTAKKKKVVKKINKDANLSESSSD